jgi:hypothetical protein
MKSKSFPLRIPDNLLDLAGVCSREQHTDKATTLRQWLYRGAEQYVLRLVEQGRITATRGAELLELSVHDIYRLAQAEGMKLGATEDQYLKSREEARRFLARTGDGKAWQKQAATGLNRPG